MQRDCSGICVGCESAVSCPIMADKLTWEASAWLHVLREWAEAWIFGADSYLTSYGSLRTYRFSRQISISANPIEIGGRR